MSTISGCTRRFLASLQSGYPSTVPTVARIGAKLLPYEPCMPDEPCPTSDTGPATGGKGLCQLCLGILDTVRPKASALSSVNLSIQLSCPTGNGAPSEGFLNLQPYLCHACQRVVCSMVSKMTQYITEYCIKLYWTNRLLYMYRFGTKFVSTSSCILLWFRSLWDLLQVCLWKFVFVVNKWKLLLLLFRCTNNVVMHAFKCETQSSFLMH